MGRISDGKDIRLPQFLLKMWCLFVDVSNMIFYVFEKFKNRCLENYGLHPCHNLIAPVVMQWLNSYFRCTCIFKKGRRGGVSYVSERYSKAKYKRLTSYDSKMSAKYITYFDKNNLYDYAISKSFPASGFKWLDPGKFHLNK